MKKIIFEKSLLFCVFIIFGTNYAGVDSALHAGELQIKIGPAAPGNGGPNPLSIPPVDIVQYEFAYVMDNDTEWSLGIVPGIFYGYRTDIEYDMYFSAGFGLVIGANGGGPGVYAAIGRNFTCGYICFFGEYKQALGLAGTIISPYALRLGASYEL